jgi:hypothetical protein
VRVLSLLRAGEMGLKLPGQPNGGHAMNAEDDVVETADDTADVPTGTEIEASEEGTEEQAGEGSGEPEKKTEKKDELPEDAPEWAVKRIGKLTARRHEAESARDEAVKERDAYKSEAETLRAKYTDKDIIAAARKTGVLPELMTKAEAETLTRAEELKTRVDGLEQALDDYPEGYEGQDGKTVTPQQMRTWLRQARNELGEIGDEAAALRKAKAEEVRELLRLGRAAKAKGWSPEAARKVEAAGKPPVKAKPGAGAAAAEPAAAARRPATAGAGKGAADFSKVKSQDDFVAMLAKKYGG